MAELARDMPEVYTESDRDAIGGGLVGREARQAGVTGGMLDGEDDGLLVHGRGRCGVDRCTAVWVGLEADSCDGGGVCSDGGYQNGDLP